MSSFYGGKQGRTYNIVQRYNSVHDMVEAFSGGGAYTKANYGQYVIIDTILDSHRSDSLENGLLYRRGFDYNDSESNHHKPTVEEYTVDNVFNKEGFQQAWSEWVANPGGGAIYVGQIVGPEGKTPRIQVTNWSNYEQTAASTEFQNWHNSVILDSKPGKDKDISGNVIFNDVIQAGYINMIDTHGDVRGAFLAFDIPYSVHEMDIEQDDPYSKSGIRQLGSDSSDEESSLEHPFWYKWLFTIPKGKRGQDIEEIKIEDSAAIGVGQYRLTSDKEINPEKTYYILQNEQYVAVENPIVQNISIYYEADKYFTYSVRDYQESAAGVLTEHLGRWPYRVIDGITLINDNRTIINWQNGQEAKVGDLYQKNLDPSAENYNDIKNLYWVCIKAGHIVEDDNIGHDSYFMPDLTSLDQVGLVVNNLQETAWRVINIPQTAPAHSITVSYTAGTDDQFEKVLRNVDHLSVDQLGNLYAFYSDDIDQSYYLTNIGGLKTGSGDQDKGVVVTDDSVKFIYTNGTVLTYPLKQILSVDFYTGTPQRDEQTNQWKYDEQEKLVFDSYDQDSNLKIRYKDGNYNTFEVKRINRIVYNNSNLNASQHIRVQYLGGQQTNVTEVPVNMVSAIGRQGDNILVLYSDPGVREQIPQDKQIIVPSWTDPSTGTSYNNLVWYNFGPLGAQYHIQGEYNIADLKGDTTDPDFTIDLSEGFKGDLEGRMGWLVTLTDENDNKRLYAFDYNDDLENPSHELYDGTSSCWYEIMELSATMINPDRVVAISPASTTPTTLVDNGLWFVVSYGHDENI